MSEEKEQRHRQYPGTRVPGYPVSVMARGRNSTDTEALNLKAVESAIRIEIPGFEPRASIGTRVPGMLPYASVTGYPGTPPYPGYPGTPTQGGVCASTNFKISAAFERHWSAECVLSFRARLIASE
eukprot:2340625-Rhodomonas_salina.2